MLKFPVRQIRRPVIQLTALIDMVFLLLIFFLLASRFVEQAGLIIEVPEIESGGEGIIPELFVQIDQDGTIFIDETSVTQSQLTLILRGRIKSINQDTVIIQADYRAQYNAVVQAIDAAKLAGAKNLVLVTRRKRATE